MEALVEMLKDYKLKQQFENDQITCKWLQAKCNTLILKLRFVE
jgi:hypothetical protein